MAITLYGFDGSTYVRTVRMLLAEKGAQYDQVPVHVLKGEPRQPEHLARHPFGKVPVVDHDGFRILETSAIAPYLDEVLPGPSFMPDNAKDRARMRMAIGIIDSYGYDALVGVAGYHLFPDFIGGRWEQHPSVRAAQQRVLHEPPTSGLVRPSEGCQQPATAVCGWFTEVFEALGLTGGEGAA